jgi:hypothetical protein
MRPDEPLDALNTAHRDGVVAILDGLAALEDLAADVGLRLEFARRHLDGEALAAGVADVGAALEALRRLLARLPAEDGPEVIETGDRPAYAGQDAGE